MIVIERPSDGAWLNLAAAGTIIPARDGAGLLATVGDTTFMVEDLTHETIKKHATGFFSNTIVISRNWVPFDSYLSPYDRAGEPRPTFHPDGEYEFSEPDVGELDGITDLIK